MSSPRLREVFASLHHAHRDAAPPLTREAERAIGRRVARRWALRGVAFGAAGSLLFAGAAVWASSSATDNAEASATPSPSPSGAEVFSVAQIPVSGGSEFTVLDDAYLCGDPAPAANPTERDLALALVESQDADFSASEPALLEAGLTFEGPVDAGTATVGSFAVLLVRDGRIAGVMQYGDIPSLAWSLQPDAAFTPVAPLVADYFVCKRRSAHAQHAFFETKVAPGEYDVMAVARVFATEESVALGQALPPQYYLSDRQTVPGGIYLPGSYDCRRLEEWGTVVRGCLPDVTSAAWMENGTDTVSVRYDASAFVAPLDVTLASKRVNVTVPSWEELNMGDLSDFEVDQEPVGFESAEQVVCSATSADPGFDFGSREGVEVWADLPPLDAFTPRTYQAEVMPWLAQDGSSVRLEEGARLAYTRYADSTSDDPPWPLIEVVGFAPVALTDMTTYDRYAGPSHVQLEAGEPEPCAAAGDDSIRRAAEALLVGTWAVTAPNGDETRHELVIPIRALP